MKKTAMPGIYPMPGEYSVDYMNFSLGTAVPGAKIYYTTDGTDPTFESTEYCFEKDGTIPMLGFMEQPENGVKKVTVKAFAAAPGLEPSNIAEFQYTFFTARPGTYNYEMLRQGTEDIPGLFRITDYCRANMFLVVGSKRAMLIDGGVDTESDIFPFINELTGGLPVDLFVTHGHMDHNAATKTFLDNGCNVYVNDLDIPTYLMGGGKPCPSGTTNILDGDSYDLGNTKLTAYFMPGHTPGGFVIIDEKAGDLFASDELVNNDPWGPNSLLLGLEDNEDCALESYYDRVVELHRKVAGKAKRIWTGHNTFSHDADMYFDHLIGIMKHALDIGEDALVPYIRPSDELNAMVGYGDFRTDFCSFAISIRYLYKDDAKQHKTVKHFDL